MLALSDTEALLNCFRWGLLDVFILRFARVKAFLLSLFRVGLSETEFVSLSLAEFRRKISKLPRSTRAGIWTIPARSAAFVDLSSEFCQ